MRFKWGQQKVLLNGLRPDSVREVKFKKKDKVGDSDMQLNMIYAYGSTEENPMSLKLLKGEAEKSSTMENIEKLTDTYADIFTEPTSLPPFINNHNHKIVLK